MVWIAQSRVRPTQKLKNRITAALAAVLLFGSSVVSGLVPLVQEVFAAPAHIIVTESNAYGWNFVDDNGQGGSGGYEIGPSGSEGAGSAELSVSAANQGYMLYKVGYGNTKLSDITTLAYKTYVQQGNNTIAPALQLNIDKDVTDTNTAWQGRLVYEPYRNGSVTDGTWQAWNTLSGNWWLTQPATFDGNCSQAAPCSLAYLTDLYGNIGINNFFDGGVLFKAGSGWSVPFTGNVDSFHIETSSANDFYDFEPTLPDTSKFAFVGSPKYVRVSSSDEAARIRVSTEVSEARFYIDGSTAHVNGTFVGPASPTAEWWKLITPLIAGEHTITAKVNIDGNWYDVNESGTAYSIDAPWAEYVIPQADQFFRPNDRVVRVKADDQFNQFKRMEVMISGNPYVVDRSDCFDQGSYVLCDLSNLNLPAGVHNADTTTYTKAGNRVDNLISHQFTIDATPPEVTNLIVENIFEGAVVDEIQAAATASDDHGVESVNFYLTAPREDGACTGNGEQLLSQRILTPDSDNTYRHTFDVGAMDGHYCLTATARDQAKSNTAMTIAITINNAHPEVNAGSIPNPINEPTQPGASASDENGIISYEWTQISGPGLVTFSDELGASGTSTLNPYISADVVGEYKAELSVTDGLGQVSSEQLVFRWGSGVIFPPFDNSDTDGPGLGLLTNQQGANNLPQTGPADEEDNDDEQILSEQTSNPAIQTAATGSDITDPTTACSSFYGVCWYWFVPIALTLVAIVYYFFRSFKKNNGTSTSDF